MFRCPDALVIFMKLVSLIKTEFQLVRTLCVSQLVAGGVRFIRAE
jgi:hypothetical protein